MAQYILLYVAFAKNNFTYWHPEKGPYIDPGIYIVSLATKLPYPLLVSFVGMLSPNSERDPIVPCDVKIQFLKPVKRSLFRDQSYLF